MVLSQVLDGGRFSLHCIRSFLVFSAHATAVINVGPVLLIDTCMIKEVHMMKNLNTVVMTVD